VSNEPLPTESELFDLLKQKFPYSSVSDDEFALGESFCLPMSIDQYYDNFLKDGAPFSLEVFNREV
jgi:hypothetical protein